MKIINIMFLLLIVFLPLLGSIISGLGGKFLGHKGSVILSINSVFFCFLFSRLGAYNNIYLEKNYYILLAPWIHSGILNCNWAFLFDTLTFIMLIIVTSISTLVHIYSSEYMSQDPHLSRFMSYLNLFTFFMIILVTSDNFLQMFVGWEGVGLCSYLLINFWFTRIQANKAAIKAMLLNRVGDFSLLIGIFLIFIIFKSVNYCTVSSLVPFFKHFSVQILN